MATEPNDTDLERLQGAWRVGPHQHGVGWTHLLVRGQVLERLHAGRGRSRGGEVVVSTTLELGPPGSPRGATLRTTWARGGAVFNTVTESSRFELRSDTLTLGHVNYVRETDQALLERLRAEPEAPQALRQPPFPALEWDDVAWSGRERLSSWKAYRIRTAPLGRPARGGQGAVQVSVMAESPQARPTREQIAAYAYLKENEARLTEAIVQALFREYPRLRSSRLGCFEDEETGARVLPDIGEPRGLERLIGLHTVHVRLEAHEGVAYLGFELGCSWDEEHGLGVVAHRDRVVEIGDASTAFDHFTDTLGQEGREKARKKGTGPGRTTRKKKRR